MTVQKGRPRGGAIRNNAAPDLCIRRNGARAVEEGVSTGVTTGSRKDLHVLFFGFTTIDIFSLSRLGSLHLWSGEVNGRTGTQIYKMSGIYGRQ